MTEDSTIKANSAGPRRRPATGHHRCCDGTTSVHGLPARTKTGPLRATLAVLAGGAHRLGRRGPRGDQLASGRGGSHSNKPIRSSRNASYSARSPSHLSERRRRNATSRFLAKPRILRAGRHSSTPARSTNPLPVRNRKFSLRRRPSSVWMLTCLDGQAMRREGWHDSGPVLFCATLDNCRAWPTTRNRCGQKTSKPRMQLSIHSQLDDLELRV